MAKRKKTVEPLRLRFGVGDEPGFTKAADFVGTADGSVERITSAFHFHRIDRAERFEFMNECWRVLKDGGEVTITVPHYKSIRAVSDPWAVGPLLGEASFTWCSREWREASDATSLPLTCNFTYGYGHTEHPGLIGRNEEFVAFAKEHETDWVFDIHIVLTKQP